MSIGPSSPPPSVLILENGKIQQLHTAKCYNIVYNKNKIKKSECTSVMNKWFISVRSLFSVNDIMFKNCF
jgi:hypothetical protein